MNEQCQGVLADVVKRFGGDCAKFREMSFGCFVNERVESVSDWKRDSCDRYERENERAQKRERKSAFSSAKKQGEDERAG